jgi:Ca2+-binding RTX toxin-like protein
MDTSGSSMSYVTNTGTITGTGGFLAGVGVDGDGVDIDGQVTLVNHGSIIATGVDVPGELQEAVTIGGGSITNYADGTITSFERAITVDDSNGGDAFAPTTIDNEGLIHGGNGQAISITDTFADTITNKGTIEGSISTGGGDDTFNLYAGSTVTGAIDGGDGTDTIKLYGPGTGAVGNLADIEVLNLFSGDWTLGSEGIPSVNFEGAGTLRLEAGLLADHHFDGTIGGLSNLDMIDLEGVGLASAALLGAGNLLTLSGEPNGPVTLQLDPSQSFAGYVFQLSSDGAGGTDVTIAKVINGGNGDEVLTGTAGNDVISGGNGKDTITSGDGNDTVSGGNGNDVLHTGNGNSVLDGGNGDDTLQVGTGDNSLTGGNGNDSFVFGSVFGKDVITDFSHGDHIEFDGAFANFQAVQAAMHQTGADTVIEVDASHMITLLGVSEASLHASDFIFH